MAARWTDAKIKALRPGERKRYALVDHGLRIAVYPSGRKAWFLRYKVRGRDEMLKLGEYGDGQDALSLAQAVAKATELHQSAGAAREGHAPTPKDAAAVERAERLADPTVSDLADHWLKAPGRRGPKSAATVAEYRRMLDRDVIPTLGALRVSHVTDRHIRSVLDKVAERGRPVAVSEVGKMLRAMFRHAVESALLEVSPVARMTIQPAERRKDRVLSDAELRALFQVLDESRIGPSVRLALLFVLTTACRPGEAIGARWSEFDLDAGTWTIPAARYKTRRRHEVLLSPAALALLDQAREIGKGPVVFPGVGEEGKAALDEQALSHAVRRLRPRLAEHGVEDAFTPHDLRRTAATIVSGRLGLGRFSAGLVLGHADDGGSTGIYDRHDYAPERRRAWNALGEYVAALRDGNRPKVASINAARAG